MSAVLSAERVEAIESGHPWPRATCMAYAYLLDGEPVTVEQWGDR